MGNNRPWTIWWDFTCNTQGNITHVVVETDHPKQKGELIRIPIEDVENENGCISEWIEGPYSILVDSILSGRTSINKWVKNPTMDVD